MFQTANTTEHCLPLQCALAPLESRDLHGCEHGECGGTEEQHILAQREARTPTPINTSQAAAFVDDAISVSEQTLHICCTVFT